MELSELIISFRGSFMTIYDDYFLSGGVICMLLTHVLPGRRDAREHQQGSKDACTEKEQMYNLSNILCGSPSVDRSFESQKTNYKKCADEGGCALPFNDPSSITSYDSKVKYQYEDALKDMRDFVDTNFTTSKAVWFVRAVFDLLDRDKSISDDTEFYALGNGSTITKKNLLACEKLELEPFLIGLWHFILTKRSGRNCEGKNTLERVYKQEGQRTYKYIGDADKWELPKIVTRWDPEKAKEAVVEEAPSLASDCYQKVIDEQIMRTGQVLQNTFQGIKSSIDRENLLANAQIIADAFSAEKKKMAEDILKNQEKTFVDKQVNGNVAQVHMVNNGSGNQIYTVQGDFIVNRGSGDNDEK